MSFPVLTNQELARRTTQEIAAACKDLAEEACPIVTEYDIIEYHIRRLLDILEES